MANNYIKECSVSLAIRETQIKTTLRQHLTRQIDYCEQSDKNCRGCAEKGTLMHHRRGAIDTAIVEISLEIYQKFKQNYHVTCYFTLGHIPRELHSLPQRYFCALMFVAALFTIAKKQNKARCISKEEQIIKNSYIKKWNTTQLQMEKNFRKTDELRMCNIK